LDQALHKQILIGLFKWGIVRTHLCRLFRPVFRNPPPFVMERMEPNLQAFLFLGAGPRARVLDVGTGIGHFVETLERYGYSRCEGIDPFITPDLESRWSRCCDIQSVEGEWDAILLNHSLEHMTAPEEALASCRKHLAPKGKVLVHVPNIPCEQLDLYGAAWAWFHAPFHYAMPSQDGMAALAVRTGFKVVDMVCTSRWDRYVYHEENQKGIACSDPKSVCRIIEAGAYPAKERRRLGLKAQALNRSLSGDWIAYILEPV